MSVQQAYEAELKHRGYASDPAQLRAVQALERCAREWAAYKEKRSNSFKKFINHPDIPKGVYLHGGVGRGKSFLMDCLPRCLCSAKAGCSFMNSCAKCTASWPICRALKTR